MSSVARPPDRSGRHPLWKQVRDDIRARLLTGAFAGGFPGEHDLGRAYGVSRHTVREALRGLREEGLIGSARGRPARSPGNGGRARRPAQPCVPGLAGAISAAGSRPASVVRILDVRSDGVFATRLGLEESTLLLHLERLRIADGFPVAIDRIWLPAERASAVLGCDFSTIPVYDALATYTDLRVTRADDTLRALVPTPVERSLLDMPPGTAALALTRIGYQYEQPVEYRVALLRGDCFVVRPAARGSRGLRITYAADGRTAPDRQRDRTRQAPRIGPEKQ